MRKFDDIARSVVIVGGAACVISLMSAAAPPPRSAREVYNASCATCHGEDGRGRTQVQLGFDTPVPDFTDCAFASREADGDWFTVAHEGGPIRVFSRLMPAFGDALSAEEIEATIAHIRTFCTDARWPSGEFNFPKGLYTEKAFPEDEAFWTTIVNASGPTAITSAVTYEKRFGPRGQLEVTVPLGITDTPGGGTTIGFGDLALAWKQNVLADVNLGSIVSLGGELVLPTGAASKGLGGGTTIVEPFLLFGQILPDDIFFQGQVFAEFPLTHGLENEIGWRGIVGRTWASDMGWGRAWTPMLEVLGARELARGADVEWDVVPQIQISLSKRQHILFNIGARIPVTQTHGRDTQFGFYIIWDWFDGGFTEGWR
jgi:hypothetical protein